MSQVEDEDKTAKWIIEVEYSDSGPYGTTNSNYSALKAPRIEDSSLLLMDCSDLRYGDDSGSQSSDVIINTHFVRSYSISKISFKEIEHQEELRKQHIFQEERASRAIKEERDILKKNIEEFRNQEELLRTMNIKKFLKWKKDN